MDRTQRQVECLKKWAANKYRGTLELATGFGQELKIKNKNKEI